MPAKERSVAVRCRWTEPGGEWGKDREQASHSGQTGHGKGSCDYDETEAEPRCY